MQKANATILLVDDDDDTRKSIRRVLEKKGYSVIEADGPVKATEIAHKRGSEIDLVILDVVMPGMSGISVADRLAEEPKIGELKILYISGFIEGELPERHEGRGESAFLQKPFSVEELLARVDGLLVGSSEDSRGDSGVEASGG